MATGDTLEFVLVQYRAEQRLQLGDHMVSVGADIESSVLGVFRRGENGEFAAVAGDAGKCIKIRKDLPENIGTVRLVLTVACPPPSVGSRTTTASRNPAEPRGAGRGIRARSVQRGVRNSGEAQDAADNQECLYRHSGAAHDESVPAGQSGGVRATDVEVASHAAGGLQRTRGAFRRRDSAVMPAAVEALGQRQQKRHRTASTRQHSNAAWVGPETPTRLHRGTRTMSRSTTSSSAH